MSSRAWPLLPFFSVSSSVPSSSSFPWSFLFSFVFFRKIISSLPPPFCQFRWCSQLKKLSSLSSKKPSSCPISRAVWTARLLNGNYIWEHASRFTTNQINASNFLISWSFERVSYFQRDVNLFSLENPKSFCPSFVPVLFSGAYLTFPCMCEQCSLHHTRVHAGMGRVLTLTNGPSRRVELTKLNICIYSSWEICPISLK